MSTFINSSSLDYFIFLLFSFIYIYIYIYIYILWRHNEVLEIFSEVSKTCCETANKALNIINNRAIQFVKEGNISKIARENMRKPSLLEGCMDWHVTTNSKYNFIFPTEIALTTKRPDIVICSIKAKKVFIIDLTVPYEENFN